MMRLGIINGWDEGHFKTVRIGSAIRISKKSFDEWLDNSE